MRMTKEETVRLAMAALEAPGRIEDVELAHAIANAIHTCPACGDTDGECGCDLDRYAILQDEERAEYNTGDPRRCRIHPDQVTSSPDGMFDSPCPRCEFEGEE